MKKPPEIFWVWLIVLVMFVSAFGLAKFLKWSDNKPAVRQALGLE